MSEDGEKTESEGKGRRGFQVFWLLYWFSASASATASPPFSTE